MLCTLGISQKVNSSTPVSDTSAIQHHTGYQVVSTVTSDLKSRQDCCIDYPLKATHPSANHREQRALTGGRGRTASNLAAHSYHSTMPSMYVIWCTASNLALKSWSIWIPKNLSAACTVHGHHPLISSIRESTKPEEFYAS